MTKDLSMKKLIASILIILCFQIDVLAMEEGTRHITGKNVNLYFMNDKVFGTVGNNPIWAIYNCATDIQGEMDIKGTYHKFSFQYHRQGERVITGSFGSMKMALGGIERKDKKLVYHVFVGDSEYIFSIRYERIEDEHMVNSIIEGELPGEMKIKLMVDGHLCPFATTGIILITVGSLVLS